MKKELVVIGCSFSHDYVVKHTDSYREVTSFSNNGYVKYNDLEPFKIWPVIVAEKLNLKLVNLSASGSGNERIFSKALDYVSKNHKKISKVIVQWSGILRLDLETLYDLQLKSWQHLNASNMPDHGHPDGYDQIMKGLAKKSWPNVTSGINGWLRRVYSLQNVFMQLNVDYHFVTGITEIKEISPGILDKDWDYKCANALLKSQYFDLIDKEKYIGWPVWKDINGFCFQDLIHSDEENNWKYWVSKTDGHPNKLGHEKIAEVILNEI